MNLAFSPEETAFRDEVRDFVRTNLPDVIRTKNRAGDKLTRDEYVGWQRILADKGWAGFSWPKQYGGPGWNAVQRHVFLEELAANWAPRVMPFGISMLAPVLMEFGSEEQRREYLPKILDCTHFWCQGYSEPGAGSDLASLQLRAERVGDRYVLNGTKTWITVAQWADHIFVLTRTNPNGKKHEGISFILVDMKASPGITVRPIVTIDGGDEINEVAFENVEVPVENLVGKENEAWAYAMYLLEHERTGTAGIAGCRLMLQSLRDLIEREAIVDERLEDRIAHIEIELEALAFTELRALAAEAGTGRPGPESSILKVKGTEIQQRIAEAALDAVGPYTEAHAAPAYYNLRKTSIYAGSNEIQRNIIAKRILKL